MTVAPTNAVEHHIAAWIEDAASGVMADQAAELAAKDALIADLALAVRYLSNGVKCLPLGPTTALHAVERALAYVHRDTAS